MRQYVGVPAREIGDRFDAQGARLRELERREPYTPWCHVSRKSGLTLPDGVATPVPWDSEIEDPLGMHSLLANTEQIAAPISAFYICEIALCLELITGVLRTRLWHNGTAVREWWDYANGTRIWAGHSATLHILAGEYVYWDARQDSGGPLDLLLFWPRAPMACVCRTAGGGG